MLDKMIRRREEELSSFSRSDEALKKKAELGRLLTFEELDELQLRTLMMEVVDVWVDVLYLDAYLNRLQG